MPSPSATPTPITPPRVPLIDERTGLIDRAWYMFFLSLFRTAQGADDASLGSNPQSLISSYDEALRTLAQFAETLPQPADCCDEIDGIKSEIATRPSTQVGELQQQIDALRQEVELLPSSEVGELQQQIDALRQSIAPVTSSAPVTKTADFTVAAGETWIINNKSGSSCTVTLPTASASSGRVLYFQNYQAQTLVSASSNVVPRAGGSAGTAILANVAGDVATLVSDGTNWITMQYVPNNVLLLE